MTNKFFAIATSFILFFVLASGVASAQTEDVTAIVYARPSACAIKMKNIKEENERKYVKLQCELDLVKLSKEISEARAATKPQVTDPIGVAASNKAVTTATYRDSNGVAFEGSREGVRHMEKMAEIAKGSKDPCSGKMAWFTCPVIPVAVVPVYSYRRPVVEYTTGDYRQTPVRVRGYTSQSQPLRQTGTQSGTARVDGYQPPTPRNR